MHSLLEAYLSEVAAQLNLPPKERNEELREMRTHLENAVTVNQAQGQAEDEAAQAALSQFGTPEAVAQETVTAWQRGEALSRRSFWGAAICTLAVWFLVPLALVPLEIAYSHPINPAQVRTTQSVLPWLNFCCQAAVPLLAGAMSGLLFSKRVVQGAALGALLYCVLCQGVFLYWLNRPGHVPLGHSVSWTAFGLAVQSLEGGLIALLGAWAGSRTRRAWQGHGRLTGG